MIQKNEKEKHENVFQMMTNVVRAMLHMNRGSVVYGAFGSPDRQKSTQDSEDDVRVFVKHDVYNMAFERGQTGKKIPNDLE